MQTLKKPRFIEQIPFLISYCWFFVTWQKTTGMYGYLSLTFQFNRYSWRMHAWSCSIIKIILNINNIQRSQWLHRGSHINIFLINMIFRLTRIPGLKKLIRLELTNKTSFNINWTLNDIKGIYFQIIHVNLSRQKK